MAFSMIFFAMPYLMLARAARRHFECASDADIRRATRARRLMPNR
jgi:hypothetical protein